MSDCQHTILHEHYVALVESEWVRQDDGTYQFHEEIEVKPTGRSVWSCVECDAVVSVNAAMRLVS